MTPQEAIQTIKMAIAQVEWEYPMDYAAAFDYAIKAIESLNKVHEIINDDKYGYSFEDDWERIKKIIEVLDHEQ